jgi:hypothetical protein
MKREGLLFFFLCTIVTRVETFQNQFSPTSSSKTPSLTSLSVNDKNEDTDPARRSLLITSTGIAAWLAQSLPVQAQYGTSTSLQLPNYIEYLIEKNESQDSSKVLYKGVDPRVLLQRLLEADKRLRDIPTLAEEKKWTQIQGTITGPLGTLAMTINQIATPDSSSKVKDAAKKVKGGVIAIGQAAAKKDPSGCAEMSRAASRDLETFVKLAFE